MSKTTKYQTKAILSPQTYIKDIVEQVESGIISRAEAVQSVTSQQVESLFHNQLKLRLEELQNQQTMD